MSIFTSWLMHKGSVMFAIEFFCGNHLKEILVTLYSLLETSITLLNLDILATKQDLLKSKEAVN